MISSNRTTWDFLANTYWYVPVSDLPALQFMPDDNLLSWRGDQTVWHITGYKNGYLWGASGAALFSQGEANEETPPPVQHSRMVGSVSADGRVVINFVNGSGNRVSIITGYGQMVQVGGEWAFQMQMSTAAGGGQLLHWANMLQTKPGEPSFAKLPGVNYSVPDMLEGASYPIFETE